MKKHLKKALFVFTFAMVTIVAHARLWTISCTNGNVYNYISLEDAESQAEIDDVHQAQGRIFVHKQQTIILFID